MMAQQCTFYPYSGASSKYISFKSTSGVTFVQLKRFEDALGTSEFTVVKLGLRGFACHKKGHNVKNRANLDFVFWGFAFHSVF